MSTSQVSIIAVLIVAGDITAENFKSSKFLPVAKYLNVNANLSFAGMHSLMFVSCLRINGSTNCSNLL